VSPNSSGDQDLVDICSYGIINRRRLTTEEKQRLVAASYTSDVSVREFAIRHGIGYSTLNKWRRQYGRSADSRPGFVPVALTDRQDIPDRSSDRQEDISLPEPVDEAGIARIVIALPNGRRVDVRETIPPRRLKHLLSVLEVS
jgi:transposase